MPIQTSPNAGSDMLRIHKAITRGIAVATEHARACGPEANISQGYRIFLGALVEAIESHHLAEDEAVFPYWQKVEPEIPFDQLAAQHRMIVPLAGRLSDWLAMGDEACEPAGMAHLAAALNALVLVWSPHIALEEGYFSPATCYRKLTPEQNADFARQVAAKSQEHIRSPQVVVPFVLYNLELEARQAWAAALPAQIMEQLVPVAWKAAWTPMQPFLLE